MGNAVNDRRRRPRLGTVTEIGEALEVADAVTASWQAHCDVLVVGWGAAGASCALEARAQGADVCVLDRFSGGGASALSGGVVYAGGGTPYQQQAGHTDRPEWMAAYLSHEVGDVVQPRTLQRFCEDSAANLAWLEQHGVRFGATTPRHKTSYPPAGVFLYYSGNEVVPRYAVPGVEGPPAPRGHRAISDGQSGAALFAALACATRQAGVRCLTQTAVRRLVVEASSRRVVGVQAWQLPAHHEATRRHAELDRLIPKWRLYQPGRAESARREQADIEREHARPLLIRARRAVVLSTGGYIYNRELLERHAPQFKLGWPIGGAGCDGSGLRLGQSVGGAAQDLDNISAWRFITPPYAWPKGLVVNARGERFCNEQVYGATLGHEMMAHQGGRAWLILDGALRWQTLRDCLFGRLWAFQSLPALLMMFKVAVKAPTLADLARRIGADAATLQAQVEQASAAARGECEDAFGKSTDMRHVFGKGPFFAIDISITQKFFPLATLSLGGLRVDEDSGQVLDAQGVGIAGLYAAGRSAIGLASRRYVSGLSLADCIFSGRRAGRASAATHA